MRTRFAIGFVLFLALSWQFTQEVYECVLNTMPGPWVWLMGLPILGYWVGQAPRDPVWHGAVWGWIALPLVLWLPDVEHCSYILGSYGGCGTGRRFAWMEATALLFCVPAALGQLRCFLRKTAKKRLPE